MTALLVVATLAVRAALAVVIVAAAAAIAVLLAEQASITRTAITKENRHDHPHA